MRRERPPARRPRKGRVGLERVLSPGDRPSVSVAEVAERDSDGELWVRMARAPHSAPLIRLAPSDGQSSAPGLGDRLLVRIQPDDAGEAVARLVKRLGQSAHRVLGVVRRTHREIRIEPVDRRARAGLVLSAGGELADGDLVLAQVDPGDARPHGPKRARLVTKLGREDDPRVASLIAAHVNGIPMGFSSEALAEAEAAQDPRLAGRVDLRTLPLVTIDPADARDHDDAVFAEADQDSRNVGGWVITVAIADVAAFVRPESALDRDASERGNSVYFPDRVEPMLPEILSAGLCSLGEGEGRACVAVRMVFDAQGRKRSHRFERGLMRSAASLTYEEAQAAIDGAPNDRTAPLLDPVLRPLWGAFRTLNIARKVRSPLEIATAERRVELDSEGQVVSIRPRILLEAHRLIEEFMIQANVCAAETLERRRTPAVYRVHDAPTADKLEALKDFLATLGIPWSSGEAPRTSRFNQLLAQTRSGPHAQIVNEVVLRTQMQAQYSIDNVGHFGLNLDRYAHFTSPIRRYADLLVHRGLIAALDLGTDGLTAADSSRLPQVAEHISATERRAMAAEREAVERYVAAFLAERVGSEFTALITGVTRFGLFLRLEETGADGLVPIASLGGEYLRHDEASHSLVGERSGVRWRLGRTVEARLKEANPLTGGLLFEMISEPEPADETWRGAPLKRGRSRVSRLPKRRRRH